METQAGLIVNGEVSDIARPISGYVRIFREDGIYYGLLPNGTLEQISGGLTSVSHDATLSGDGTPGNPLSVVGGSVDVESGTYDGQIVIGMNVAAASTNNIKWYYNRVGKQVKVSALFSLELINANDATQFMLSVPAHLPILTIDPNITPTGIFTSDHNNAVKWKMAGVITTRSSDTHVVASSQEGPSNNNLANGNVVAEFTYQTP